MNVLFIFFDKLRKKREFEDFMKDLMRKGARVLVGTFLILSGLYVHQHYGIEYIRNITIVLAAFAIISDCLRLTFKIRLPYYEPFVMRDYETVSLHGTTLALVGCLLAYYVAGFDIAISAIAMYVYGDAAAGLVGMRLGKIKIIGKKSLEGSFLMFLTSLIVGLLMLKDFRLALFMAGFATIIELFFLAPADDLALPFFTALGGQCIGGVFGIRPCMRGLLGGLFFVSVSMIIAIIFVRIYNWLRRRI